MKHLIMAMVRNTNGFEVQTTVLFTYFFRDRMPSVQMFLTFAASDRMFPALMLCLAYLSNE